MSSGTAGKWLVSTALLLVLAVLVFMHRGSGSIQALPKGLKPAGSVYCLETVTIPGGTTLLGSNEAASNNLPREKNFPDFNLQYCEVTVEEYGLFLRETGRIPPADHPQFRTGATGWELRKLKGKHAVSHVALADAENYCRWLQGRVSGVVRLPSEWEWEHAARSGNGGGPFPWGWGDPKGRAAFKLKQPCPVARYPLAPSKLADMAGGVYEWCAPDPDSRRPFEAPIRGGSWAEHLPDTLKVYSRAFLRREYRGPDVGFRVLVESGK